MNVRLTPSQKIPVMSSADVFKVMQQVLLRENKIDRNKEHFWVVCLSASNHILLIELISLGTIDRTLVDPREIFSFALQKKESFQSAVKIILVHNHPSGNLDHSPADWDITEKMWAIGNFLHLPVVDHIIISEKGYMSFTDEGLLASIAKTERYDLSFSKLNEMWGQIKELEMEKELAARKQIKAVAKAQKETEEKAKKILAQKLKEEKMETARKMLDDGQAIELIVKYTGLTAVQVGRLK